ncbi:MAG: type II secretion system protein GspN [Deltaproteobacteria bacterium]|nr:type II secretion system protein GspN [Deltaproteobacteria bacterium]
MELSLPASLSKLTARQRTALKIGGYVLWGLIFTLVFVAMKFPDNRLRELAEAEMSVITGKEVKVEKAGLYRLSGLDMTGVDFYSTGGFAQPLLRLKRQRIRMSILPALIGRLSAWGITEPEAGGTLELNVRAKSSDASLGLDFRQFQLSGARLEPKSPDHPPTEIDATISGKVSYSVDPGGEVGLADLGSVLAQIYGATAGIDLTITGVRLANLASETLPLSELRFDTFTIKGDIAEGRLNLSECSGTGPKGDLSLQGQISFTDPIRQSGLRLQIRYQPDEETRKTLGPVIGLKLRDDGRGVYTGYIVGQFGSPQVHK